jgi:hypothetical protein
MKGPFQSLPLTQRKGRLYFLRKRVFKFLEHYIRPHLLRRSIQHISGPETVEYGRDEVLAFCIVRNGAAYIRDYIEHHFRLGVRHIVFLDNGSTDETVAFAQEYDNITILRTTCSYRTYENVMKRYLAQRFCRGRWGLCVDIDELFDYPFSDVLSLSSLVRYLNQHGYTAVVGHMLDMFPDTTLARLHTFSPEGNIRESYPYYDVSNIRKLDYIWGSLSNPAVKRYHGGIRDMLFGTNNGLTKAVLFFVEEKIDLFVNWHHMGNARVADFTTVLLHYPFVPTFHQKVVEAVETERYGQFTVQYDRYRQGLQQIPDQPLKQATAQRLNKIEELLKSEFLVAAPAFIQWVAIHRDADPLDSVEEERDRPIAHSPGM